MLSKDLFQFDPPNNRRPPQKSYYYHINEFMASLVMFNRALRQGFWYRLWCFITRRPAHLLSMSEETAALLRHGSSSYGGVRPVEIDSIRGSLGRVSDFDNHFHPRNERVRERWLSIASSYLHGISLPAVELIQVGRSYFVVDGHHRISVMRAMGVKVLDAQVTVRHALSPAQEKTAALARMDSAQRSQGNH